MLRVFSARSLFRKDRLRAAFSTALLFDDTQIQVSLPLLSVYLILVFRRCIFVSAYGGFNGFLSLAVIFVLLTNLRDWWRRLDDG